MIQIKNCKNCNIELSLLFYRGNNNRQYCVDCVPIVNYKTKQNFRNTLRGHLGHLIHSKGRKHLTVDILVEIYTSQEGLCALSGVPMTYHHFTEQKQYTNISIDRIDSNKGYELSNIQLVCTIVNSMKNTLFENEFVWWCKQIIQTSEKE